MALSYRTRRRLSLLILALGLPVYIAVAAWTISLFDRPAIWLELLIYLALGIIWALPLRSVFSGVGQPDPAAKRTDTKTPRPPDTRQNQDRAKP